MQRREGMEWLHMQFVKPPDIGHSSVWAGLASSHIASVRTYIVESSIGTTSPWVRGVGKIVEFVNLSI